LRSITWTDDTPVRISLGTKGARPTITWYDGIIPDTPAAAEAFGASATLYRILHTYVALVEGRADVSVVNALLHGFTSGPNGASGNSNQKNIVDLLRDGLPANPTHMRGLLSFDPHYIYVIPHFSVLLHGISVTDREPERGEQILSEARTLVGSVCGLNELGLSIAIRKQDGPPKLDESISTAKSAIDALESLPGERCTGCLVKCAKNPILIGLYRNSGAAHRKRAQVRHNQPDFGISKDCFARAEALFDTTTPDDVRSELLFSFGYLLFEMATIDSRPSKFDRDLLHLSLEKFEAAMKARTDWSAPLLRVGIIRTILHDTRAASTYFRSAMMKSEIHSDGLLTRMLSRLAWLSTKDCTDDECAAAEADMNVLFENTFLPNGPRECHAFDARVLYSVIGRRLGNDVLHRCWRVFIDAGKWQENTDLTTQQRKYSASRDRLMPTRRKRSDRDRGRVTQCVL
jgi:hypothetical protein